MRLFAAILFTLLLAYPVAADLTPCTATLVTEGVCRDAANTLVNYDAPPAILAELRDAICDQNNYQALVTCTQAMVDVEECLIGELGDPVANPVTKADFADAWVMQTLRSIVRRQRHLDAAATANAGVDESVDVE